MCVMSAVTDHYQREWGTPWIDPDWLKKNTGQTGDTITIQSGTTVWITADQWNEYQRLKRAAAEIDEKTNQPDCIKPDLAEWEVQMEAYLIKKGVLNKDGLVPGMIYNK